MADSAFILVEGVNIYDHLYDTDQLSVIRGTSFLYKDAIEAIETRFGKKLHTLSSGASVGLYQVRQGLEAAAQELAQAIEQFLASDRQPYYLLTFVVVHTQAPDLLSAKERLSAQLRFKQLQNLTLLPDKAGKGGDGAALNTIPCELSGSRIAAQWQRKVQGDKKKTLSDSIYQRRKVGIDAKQHYYEKLVEDAALKSYLRSDQCKFANDIEALCKDDNQALNNKMAVVYIDGNHFGKKQRKFIQQSKICAEQIALQKKFDKTIQNQRKQFLTATLQRIVPQDIGSKANPAIIRLETLLWGGDEMLFVMPAWEGFDFLQRFFAFDWHLPKEGNKPEKLTHAAGIVFCQAKTPIRIIQSLARDLAEQVKEDNRKENGWDYLVLESIDYPTNEKLADYFEDYYQTTLAETRPKRLPAIQDWDENREALNSFLAERAISRGQLYQIVHAIKVAHDNDALDKVATVSDWSTLLATDAKASSLNHQELAERRMYQVSDDQDTLKNKLSDFAKQWFAVNIDCPRERVWFWIHLLQLWDYLIPKSSQSQSVTEERQLG